MSQLAGGGGLYSIMGGNSIIACLSRMSINHAFLARRGNPLEWHVDDRMYAPIWEENNFLH